MKTTCPKCGGTAFYSEDRAMCSPCGLRVDAPWNSPDPIPRDRAGIPADSEHYDPNYREPDGPWNDYGHR